jgi:hypothetical protein
VICLYKSFILFQMLSTRGNKSVIKRVKQEQCRKTNYPHASVNLLLNDPMFLLLCANQIYSLVYDTRQDFFFKNIKHKILHVYHFGSVSIIIWLRFWNSSDGVVIFETWKWKNTIFQYICFVVGEIVDYSTWETE